MEMAKSTSVQGKVTGDAHTCKKLLQMFIIIITILQPQHIK